MSICGASHCSRKKKCKKYIESFRRNSNLWEQYIDWSVNGSSSFGIDENGKVYIDDRWDCGDWSKTYPLFEETDVYKPKDLKEVKDFIFEILEEKYGDAVISQRDNEEIVIDTQTSYLGNSDVWISLEYFH